MSSAGELIRRVRKAQKKTLARVAEAAGISGPFLSQIESGVRNTSEETYKKIAAELDIPERELLLAAGYIPEGEKQLFSFGAEGQMFEKALYEMKGVLNNTLIAMKENGDFKSFNDDYTNLPGSIIDLIHSRTGKIEFIHSSRFKLYYDGFMRGDFDANMTSAFVSEFGQRENGIDNQLSVETAGIRRDIDPYVIDNGGVLSFSPIPFKKDMSLAEVFGFTSPDAYRFHEKYPNGLTTTKVFNVPINNLHFHLSDPRNHKLYKDFTLTVEDREQIISLIDSFLLHKYIDIVEDKDQRDLIGKLTEKPSVTLEWEREAEQQDTDKQEE